MNPRLWLPLSVSILLLLHGSVLGLSDDEAYYWVLAQKPALGYAYHPPAVAWMITVFQGLFGWLVGNHQAGLVRLPAALSSGIILFFSLQWIKTAGMPEASVKRAFAVMLSFAGFFSLSWMMVPDIPLFLGWIGLFYTTYGFCFLSDKMLENRVWLYSAGMAGSAALMLLSKYSAVLAIFSSFLAMAIWAPKSQKLKGIIFLIIGSLIAAIPTVIWNSQHEWASILYQVRDRHSGGGGISLIRWFRFWAVEIILTGPVFIGSGVAFLAGRFPVLEQKRVSKIRQYILLWTLPSALVFCLQPLIAEFKPHWAFAVWFPIFIGLAWASHDNQVWKWLKWQVKYGLALGSIVMISCHFPLGTWMGTLIQGQEFDSRLDVTNDLYGWKKLEKFLESNAQANSSGPLSHLPVFGSRYQTASQAAFSLGSNRQVSLVPLDIKERDEWPRIDVIQNWGPEWPRLRGPVLFVTDMRYDAPPGFIDATCHAVERLETLRFGLRAKWIDVWKCEPHQKN